MLGLQPAILSHQRHLLQCSPYHANHVSQAVLRHGMLPTIQLSTALDVALLLQAAEDSRTMDSACYGEQVIAMACVLGLLVLRSGALTAALVPLCAGCGPPHR